MHPLKALKVALRGPRVTGPMAPDLPVLYGEGARRVSAAIPVSQIKRPNHAADAGTSAELQ